LEQKEPFSNFDDGKGRNATVKRASREDEAVNVQRVFAMKGKTGSSSSLKAG
jgi:hypothetical protein